MPVHPHLAGVSLDVAYRGSAEPQTLDIGIELAGEAELPLAPWAIGRFVAAINRGLAGSADFAPASGRAVLEADAPKPLGPSYTFRLEVTGVSPIFLRVLVEKLAGCGHPHALEAISIVGSLPPDGTRLSVRDRELRGWLAEPGAYPLVWPEPGFDVETRPAPRGASVKVALAQSNVDEVGEELEATISTWHSVLLGYGDARRRGRGVSEPHATFARTRRDLFAKIGLFDHDRGPARAALVNTLARFHVAIAPLAAVTIAMP